MTRITQPEICSYGFIDYFRQAYPGSEIISVDKKQVNSCKKFIREYLRPARRGHTSYHFKHAVEEKFNCYISNGAFIIAALQCGCRVERVGLSNPNAYIHMDYKTGGIDE